MDTLADVFQSHERRNYFSAIDYDAPGGFARTVRVALESSTAERNEEDGYAFKVMRHNLRDSDVGRARFQLELELLQRFDQYRNTNGLLEIVTKIYDSGYVERRLSETIDLFGKPSPDWPIIRTGVDPIAFKEAGTTLDQEVWVPYLIVELASYNDSLLRQIRRRPSQTALELGLFRLPTGEVLHFTLKLLDLISWMHETLGVAYIDWKPEHIYWNGTQGKLKLIDWNITCPLEKSPGRAKNIRDDVRLLAGAALYCGLTLVDPEDGRPIGPRPTKDIRGAVAETRYRYLTDNAKFYEAEEYLDDRIKGIMRKGLSSEGYETPSELKEDLIDYSKQYLGLDVERLQELEWESSTVSDLGSDAGNAYWMALRNMRQAQQHLSEAYDCLKEATGNMGSTREYARLIRLINHIQADYPMP